MKSPDDAHFQQWNEQPEPNKNSLDGSIILELDAASDAYLWASKNSQDGWLSFSGALMEIHE